MNPSLIEGTIGANSNSIRVVIDVLRASTTICAALYNGANGVIPCGTIEEARYVYSKFGKGSAILGGERNGLKPMGFELGNSPYEYRREIVENKKVVLSTSNGTEALEKVKGSEMVVIGCFGNRRAVGTVLVKYARDNADIILVCAGNEGKASLEDTLCAGGFVNELVKRYDNCYLNDDSRYAMNNYLELKDNIHKECYNSEHGKRLIEIGFKEDIDLALMCDIYPLVPIFRGGIIKIL